MKKLKDYYIRNFKIDYGFPIGQKKIGLKHEKNFELLAIKSKILER